MTSHLERAPASLFATRLLKMADMTIGWTEGQAEYKWHRWCAYHAAWHHINSFSSQQRLSRYQQRFCQDFSNATQRARITPTTVMVPDQLRDVANKLKAKITDLVGGHDVPIVHSARTERAMQSGRGAEFNASEGVPAALGENEARDEEAEEPPGTSAAPPKNRLRSSKQTAKQLPAGVSESVEFTQHELDEWLQPELAIMAAHDETTDDSTTRDNGKRELYHYHNFQGGEVDWMLALDDVRSQHACMSLCHDLTTACACMTG